VIFLWGFAQIWQANLSYVASQTKITGTLHKALCMCMLFSVYKVTERNMSVCRKVKGTIDNLNTIEYHMGVICVPGNQGQNSRYP
jgi:hypothetical protein